MSGGKGEFAEKVDMEKEFAKFSATDRHFIKKAEALNKARAKAAKSLKAKNYMVAGLLGIAALGIYGYSIHAVKQERFLDEYDDMHKDKDKNK